jgi:hypothetical protein
MSASVSCDRKRKLPAAASLANPRGLDAARHRERYDIALRGGVVYVLFTAVLIAIFAAYRISDGTPMSLGVLDALSSSRGGFNGLRVLPVILAIGAAYMTFRTGDLGAKAVWQGRIQASQAQAHTGAPRPPA